MQACSGAALMGSLQQPKWIKGAVFPNRGVSVGGFPHQLKLNYSKSLRSYSYVEGSLVAGRTSSPGSVHVPEIRGSYTSTIEIVSIFFLFLYGSLS